MRQSVVAHHRWVKRLAAAGALVAFVAAPVAAIVFAVTHIGLVVVTAIAILAIGAAGWVVVTRTGPLRFVAAAIVVLALATIVTAFVVVLPVLHAVRGLVIVAALVVGGLGLARYALGGEREAPRVALVERAGSAHHPVLFMNPKSGGGKVERFHLVEEARRRGIEPVVLARGDDLRALALDAVARGADALGAAGGDGSQAIVATVAIDHGLPFVCVPAGTRNHLALDLGVDRDDVVAALDAFADGPERVVDVGLVGDRVFVNNVSFGVYGEVVQSDSYRDAKLRTAAEEMPELLGPGGRAPELRFSGRDGAPRATRDLVLVSNNPYDVGTIGRFGTRPQLDTGTLGIMSVRVENARDAARFTALAATGRAWDFPGCEAWTAPSFTLDADGPVAAGIDGESVRLEPPVRFRMRPRALRVWLAPSAPVLRSRAARAGLRRSTITALWKELRTSPVPGRDGSRDGADAPTGTTTATSAARRR